MYWKEDIVLNDREISDRLHVQKCSSQAVTLTVKSSVRIESDTVQVDPQLLFQRVIVVHNRFMILISAGVCSAMNCAVIQWLCLILL